LVGSPRVCRIELLHQQRRVDVCGRFPAVVFVAIAFPLDEVLKSPPRYTAVEYGFDFILLLSVNQDKDLEVDHSVVPESDPEVQA
jgi:hypothetical protein